MLQVGRYCGTPLKDHRGANQGGPLSSTIFIVVVDTVISHWVVLVAVEEAGPDRFVRAIQCLAEVLYTDVGILALPRSARLQEALDLLTRLFYRIGIQTNCKKMVGMI